MNSRARIISLLLLPFVLFTFTGCGLIFDGTKEEITVNSDPQGATVRVDGQPRGQTPLTVKIQKDTNHTIEVSKEGYESSSRVVTHSVDALWVILDLIGGSFVLWVPLIIDAATGAWYKLDNRTIYIKLEQALMELPRALEASTGLALAE